MKKQDRNKISEGQVKLKCKNSSGQTIIEILFAIALVTVVMVAVVSRTIEAVRNANFARNQALATRFAQEGVEWVRIQRDSLNWAGFQDEIDFLPSVSYCVSDLGVSLTDLPNSDLPCDSNTSLDNIPLTIFDREVQFTYVEDLSAAGSYADVTVTVSWSDNIGEHSSRLNTRLSEWTFGI